MKMNGVFEGGGVKAIGLVGALKAAEERGIDFPQVAGTSSGAIVASLLAAGYTADEMKELIMQAPFRRFLKRSWLMDIRVIGPTLKLLIKKGLYSGDELEKWIYNRLQAKGVRTFGDLPKDKLRIVASDITMGRLLVLPDDIEDYGIEPKRLLVARAIRMSTSIPYFFEPVIIRKAARLRKQGESFADQFIYVVDGGLLSNFPLWIFDNQSVGVRDQDVVPTLGFRLIDKHQEHAHKIVGPITMFQALFETMLEAHDERYIEEKNRFRTIKIPTLGVKTTDFDISKQKSEELFESGYMAGKRFFERWSHTHYMNQFKQYVRK
ncbi:patatin-like phospholipase family protein [Paenibacillus koleovorans]|uniref:patatin-like phospholipase family protein n=1 Tax=Paenibacillus koleovorans TaxID=121608 RepID=UPI000FDA2B89|nr:patatin-like phospholipase family protein [Paenibacillus koleovorans]